jgi:hypothetical protein
MFTTEEIIIIVIKIYLIKFIFKLTEFDIGYFCQHDFYK